MLLQLLSQLLKDVCHLLDVAVELAIFIILHVEVSLVGVALLFRRDTPVLTANIIITILNDLFPLQSIKNTICVC